MSEAKRRGTYEERKQQAIDRQNSESQNRINQSKRKHTNPSLTSIGLLGLLLSQSHINKLK